MPTNRLPENLSFLRAQAGLTQEQLAEQLEVSRQSVSKWESSLSFPEMDTILKLCDLFGTDMDTLLRGDAQQSRAHDMADYDQFMNRHTYKVAGSVAVILLNLALVLITGNVFAVPEMLAGALFLLVLAAAVVTLVVSGIQYDHFCKRWPIIQDFYTQAQKDAFHQKLIWYIAGGVGAVLCDLALMCLFFFFLPEREPYESVAGALFFVILAGAVFSLIYGGMMEDKYNIEKYNRQNHLTPEEKKKQNRVGIACGVIMLLAAAVHIVLRYYQGWPESRAWIPFAVGGILCGVAALLLNPHEPE